MTLDSISFAVIVLQHAPESCANITALNGPPVFGSPTSENARDGRITNCATSRLANWPASHGPCLRVRFDILLSAFLSASYNHVS